MAQRMSEPLAGADARLAGPFPLLTQSLEASSKCSADCFFRAKVTESPAFEGKHQAGHVVGAAVGGLVVEAPIAVELVEWVVAGAASARGAEVVANAAETVVA